MKKLLTLENEDNLNYRLIAIRNKLEDYLFAYHLNKSAFFNFKRVETDLSYIIANKTVYFTTFEYVNFELDQISFLIKNSSFFKNKIKSEKLLFSDEFIDNKVFLLPELKEFDYFLKLNGIWKTTEILKIRQYLNNLDTVESEIIVNIKNIKSINNLIF